MSEFKIKRALISVYDKTGIVEFASALHNEFGIEIISTGGTAKLLRENDVPVTRVEDVTGFPELLDGRVKTLHPRIHAAILADRDNPEHMRQLAEQSIEPIDMVVVNLYPFEKTIADPDCTFEQAIEMIDIGGPCLLRAAAKNHKHVLVESDPDSYPEILRRLKTWTGDVSREEVLESGAFGAFSDVTDYDARITEWLGADDVDGQPVYRWRRHFNCGRLRYGENPHQQAELLQDAGATQPKGIDLTVADSIRRGQQDLSYNNYLDANVAVESCRELSVGIATGGNNKSYSCVLVKHGNPCGVGVSSDPVEAIRRAYLGDPRAAMGGILCVNQDVNARHAEAVMGALDLWGRDAGAAAFFLEVWVAPRFEEEAVNKIRAAKKWGERVRLLDVGDLEHVGDMPETRSILGGLLSQERDRAGLNEEQWKGVTNRQPTEAEMDDLRLAWLVCKHTKSNAISICRDGMLIGNGAGQMSRVMSCRIATWLAGENGHEEKLHGAVAASDAFFPFRDGPDLLIDAGVRAVIQPGGSKRDEETIAACNERDVAMIFTGTRHFRH